jgi:hypothetical protein
MASVIPINDGKRTLRKKADGMPRQEFLFADELKLPGGGWAFVVFVRVNLEGRWSSWQPDWERPNHFRSEKGALERLKMRTEEEKRKIELGILKYKVEPKWLGEVIKVRDEEWLAD